MIAVLGSDRKHYRVLDMDFRKRHEKADGEGSDGSEDNEDGGEGHGDVEMGGRIG